MDQAGFGFISPLLPRRLFCENIRELGYGRSLPFSMKNISVISNGRIAMCSALFPNWYMMSCSKQRKRQCHRSILAIAEIPILTRRKAPGLVREPCFCHPLELLYLALQGAAKKWTMAPRIWKQAMNQFAVLFHDRFPSSIWPKKPTKVTNALGNV